MDYRHHYREELVGELGSNGACGGPRLIISEIKLENFKSYGGVRVVGPLHHCFTAIVGPNGSGKSNVMEAILFVFGKRASKLRQKKMAELVHKSGLYPDCKYARVTVDDSEFSISRTAYVDRSPEYHIDGVRATADEVYCLLKEKYGVDLDNNRFLILQGEVENIAMMSRKELLEYLEEIIGTNIFAEPILRAIEGLERITNDRASQLDYFRMVEKEREMCEVEKVKAEEYLKKMKLLCDKKAIVYSMHLNRVKGKLDQRREKRDRISREMKEVEERLRGEGIEEFGAKVKEQERVVGEALELLERYKRQLNELDEKRVRMRDILKGMERSEGEVEGEMEKYGEMIERKERDRLEMNGRTMELMEENMRGEKLLEEKREEMEGLRLELASILDPIQEELIRKQRELIPFQGRKVEVECRLGMRRGEVERLRADLQLKVRELDEARGRLVEVEEEVRMLMGVDEEVRGGLKEVECMIVDRECVLKRMKGMERRNLDVVNECRAILESKSWHQINVVIGEMKRRLPLELADQVYGRLGDLGCVESKYDVAVSTASSSLNSVVVSTSEVAQRCVQVLREYRLGRLTFIVLNEIRPKMGLESVPEGSRRLVDLIVVEDERMRPAFYFAFGNTLVCESLERSRDIALDRRRRRRVVTTNGDLFETRGTLTGGGKSKLRGLMRIVGVGCESGLMHGDGSGIGGSRAELQERLQEALENLKSVRAQMMAHDAEISEGQRKKLSLMQELELVSIRLENRVAEQKDIRRRIENLEGELNSGEIEKKEAEILKEIEELNVLHDEIGRQSKSLEEESEEIKRRLEEASGERLMAVESEFRALDARLQSNNEQIAKNEVAMESFEKIIKKSRKAMELAQRSKKELENELGQTREQMERLDEELVGLREHVRVQSTRHCEEQKKHQRLQEEYDLFMNQRNEDISYVKDLADSLRSQDVRVEEAEQAVLKLEKKLANVSRDKRETRLDENDGDIEISVLGEEELGHVEIEKVEIQINQLKEELNNMQFNKEAIEIYKEKTDLFNKQREVCEKINEDWDDKRRELQSLQTERLNQFLSGFKVINSKLQEMYRMLTSQGGSAELECSTDPFTDGISFSVRPPNKTWKNIQHLSGGEKTLSSLSLVFALHYYKPTPIYIMDEIDAALDFRNVSLVANYIKDKTKNAQFLVISLRNYMFEMADRLVGVYKTENVTKCVCIDPHSFSKKIKN